MKIICKNCGNTLMEGEGCEVFFGAGCKLECKNCGNAGIAYEPVLIKDSPSSPTASQSPPPERSVED
jgi:pyruvate-formate lyase-activating enzyme